MFSSEHALVGDFLFVQQSISLNTKLQILQNMKSERQWGSIIYKYDARWHHASRLKARSFCSFRKTANINKTYQLIPETGTCHLGSEQIRSLWFICLHCQLVKTVGPCTLFVQLKSDCTKCEPKTLWATLRQSRIAS